MFTNRTRAGSMPINIESFTHPSNHTIVEPLSHSDLDEISTWTADIVNDESRINSLSKQISEAVQRSSEAGNYILPKSDTDVADKLRSGMAGLIPGIDQNGEETFHYYRGMIPLIVEGYRQDFPIIEGGTLIAHPARKKLQGWDKYFSSHVILISNSLPSLPEDPLIINTSRSIKSKRAGLGAGAFMLMRELFPMIDALTCDPGCAPGKDGRQAGIENVLPRSTCGDCIACSVNEAFIGQSAIDDACYLLSQDPVRAVQFEQRLDQMFDRKATWVRAVLIDGEAYESSR